MGRASTEEQRTIDLVQRMLAKPQYSLPIVAAEMQIRAHYYRLNAAALLEDLFHDALTNYVKQFEPALSFRRAPKGTKGWDYQLGDLRLSHKSYMGGALAALWDATKRDSARWTFEAPLLVVVNRYAKTLQTRSRGLRLQALSTRCSMPRTEARGLKAGESLLLVHWPAADQAATVLLERRIEAATSNVWTALPFEDIWRASVDAPAAAKFNELEVFVLARGSTGAVSHVEMAGDALRPGVYVIPIEKLADVPVKPNNRALLVDARQVRTWLAESRSDGLYAPLPLWYQAYAEERPPDLYTTQRSEFDALFSSRGFRR
jgi:hypothetical protein